MPTETNSWSRESIGFENHEGNKGVQIAYGALLTRSRGSESPTPGGAPAAAAAASQSWHADAMAWRQIIVAWRGVRL